jgi:hypothetical protein
MNMLPDGTRITTNYNVKIAQLVVNRGERTQLRGQTNTEKKMQQ